MTWIMENLGTIVTLLIVMIIMVVIIYSMIRNARQGKSSCGCKCSSCPMGGTCHGRKA
ncbi:MAG: FeoB-associated Cys-rich membrane protein [Lachnospiraceae bacterium]|nr:FeoB-associated Cys-rich membrane protein [Lachnospiraceae bacterium]